MKNLLILSAGLFLFSCSSYGDKLTFEGTDVYYTDESLKEDAQKLGEYLVESEFADGGEKSVQLTKNEDGTRVFRMVVQEGAENGNDSMFTLFAMGISMSAFDNEPVNVELCDNTFTTLKTIPWAFGGSDSTFVE